eukprot:CAMPEP_0177603486 /NCGR_PEP_ID=MMETSP0419_2-20121207/15543_1 /TAXON_ID=582737 /ORGANISM="Tetraselmis sp., Strain GSL018" /LENGTH=210 /DNA_ID=CAMNT_0019097271 /DNA_START=447 /DNA_END=1079 /DNA_ORIENTATION=+
MRLGVEGDVRYSVRNEAGQQPLDEARADAAPLPAGVDRDVPYRRGEGSVARGAGKADEAPHPAAAAGPGAADPEDAVRLLEGEAEALRGAPREADLLEEVVQLLDVEVRCPLHKLHPELLGKLPVVFRDEGGLQLRRLPRVLNELGFSRTDSSRAGVAKLGQVELQRLPGAVAAGHGARDWLGGYSFRLGHRQPRTAPNTTADSEGPSSA